MIGRLIHTGYRLVFIACLGVAGTGLAALAVRFPFPAIAVGFLLVWRYGRGGGVSWAYGTATVSTLADLVRNNLLSDGGLIMGRTLPESTPKLAGLMGLFDLRLASADAVRRFLSAFCGEGWYTGRMIRVRDFVHVLTCSPAGGGKSVGAILPNLRAYPSSVVVIDPKGELARKSGWFRRFFLGNAVFYLNPYGIQNLPTATLNPLDRRFINPDSLDFLDNCKSVANAIVVRKGTETQPHFDDMAELSICGIIAFVCACEPDETERHLGTARQILSHAGHFDRATAVMQQVDGFHGVVRRLGGQLGMLQDREKGSVLTTIQRHMAFLDSPVIARSMASTSFDPLILRRRPATVFLMQPAEQLEANAGVLRLQIATMMRRMTAGNPTERNPVLWVVDEAAHVGNLPAITNGITLMRGMGMRFWLFFQSLDQLKSTFGDKASTIVDNIGTQQFFNIVSLDTAKLISERIGETTVPILTTSTTDGWSHTGGGGGPNGNAQSSSSSSTTRNFSEVTRRVYKPEELLTLRKDIVVLFHNNMSVITAKMLCSYKDKEFRWLGRGRQSGVGIVGGLVAAVSLLVSLAFADFAHRLAGIPPLLLSLPKISGDGVGGYTVPGESWRERFGVPANPLNPSNTPGQASARQPQAELDSRHGDKSIVTTHQRGRAVRRRSRVPANGRQSGGN